MVCLKTDSRHYGNRFFISSKWRNNIHRCWKVSDRIAVLQYYQSKKEHVKRKRRIIMIRLLITIKRKERYACTLKGMKIKFKRSPPKDLITIIDVYAPHTQRLQEQLTEF